MIAEYIKALGEQDLKNLRVAMNDVLSVESIHKEWKESRVVLVHKGGSKKEVRNYRPITIINVICERIQESGRRAWKYGFNDTEKEKEYVRMK